MSENIRGITFAEQSVTPADDAIVRRAILGDGVLTGCAVSYSGSTLTMAPGYIIACGRSFQITSAQNWAVVDATSGVARLLLTIDLTKTATESAFNQIDFSVEYALAEDGFVDLVQEDINIAGTKYQIVAAVVSLGTGGITGIVSKLEKTEGGGGGLNFKVVPGLTQPGTATENTIWVKTERITSWIFSATEPENPVEGMVWFPIGTSSDVAFNALTKNGIQVYPLSAKQCVDGSLVDVIAMSYQGGEWIEWFVWNGELYISGDEFKSVTGGWEAWDDNAVVTKFEDHISLYSKTNVTSCGTQKAINLTNAKGIRIKASAPTSSQTQNYIFAVCTDKLISTKVSYVTIAGSSIDKEILLDISGLSGEFFIAFTNFSSSLDYATNLYEAKLVL